jgi:hypothetical protein
MTMIMMTCEHNDRPSHVLVVVGAPVIPDVVVASAMSGMMALMYYHYLL